MLLTKKNSGLDVIEMNLSNGAKVVLKHTDFKNDEILFRATVRVATRFTVNRIMNRPNMLPIL